MISTTNKKEEQMNKLYNQLRSMGFCSYILGLKIPTHGPQYIFSIYISPFITPKNVPQNPNREMGLDLKWVKRWSGYKPISKEPS